MYFAEYLDCYTKKDRRVMKQAYDKYRLFISLHNLNESRIPDTDTIRLFAEFLQKTSRGTGTASTYGRFRKVVIDGILKEMQESIHTLLIYSNARDLKYGNIDYTNRLITFEQSKTKDSSSRSVVYIPIREDLLRIIEVHDKKRMNQSFISQVTLHV